MRNLVFGCLALALAGCGHDATGPAPLGPADAFWRLQLDYHAVNLALFGSATTVQLTATPLNVHGQPLEHTGPAAFVAHDSAVTVTPAGVMTAQYETGGTPTYVVATLQYQNVTLTDTVWVQVTATAPAAPLATLTLRPADGKSATCNANFTGIPFLDNCGPLVVDATDAAGDSLANAAMQTILVAYASSDPLTASVDQFGQITELDTGHVTLSASTWAYGVAMRDSVRYTISWPRWQVVQMQSVTPVASDTSVLIPAQPDIVLNAGGSLGFYNQFGRPLDIVFDDPSSVQPGCYFAILCSALPSTGGGNVDPFYYDETGTDPSPYALGIVLRAFPVAGTYRYHSTRFPSVVGTIRVRPTLAP